MSKRGGKAFWCLADSIPYADVTTDLNRKIFRYRVHRLWEPPKPWTTSGHTSDHLTLWGARRAARRFVAEAHADMEELNERILRPQPLRRSPIRSAGREK